MVAFFPFQSLTSSRIETRSTRTLEGEADFENNSDSPGLALDCYHPYCSSTKTSISNPISTLQMIPPLPEDIFIMIFQYLALQEVLSMRTVCKSFKDMTHLRGLWILILRKEVWGRNIPTPRIDLNYASAAQIERLVASGLSLHRNWTSGYPKAVRRRHVTVDQPRARITSLKFITLEGCSCLLSFSLTSREEPRRVVIECWDLNSLECKARRTVQWFGLRSDAVNSDPDSTAIIAIRSPNVEILAFDPTASNAESAFMPLITLGSTFKNVLSLAGPVMFFRTMNNALKILDITRPSYAVKLEDRQPLVSPNQRDIFEAIVVNEWAIVVRPKTLAIYPLHAFRRGSHPPSVPLSPVQVYEFLWNIDNCVIQIQVPPSAQHLSNKSGFSKINILIRYSSDFLWPTNYLHHYTLYPNDSYIESATGDYSLENLPYHFPPLLSQTIVSPVRLFARTDMALGPQGTAVWLDSHTDYHEEVGQRLAGLMLRFSNSREESENDSEQVSTTASMVFGAHDTDDWTCMAVDEVEGRIALGTVTGEIIIGDYAEK